MSSILFLCSGSCSFVLPKNYNFKYIDLQKGCYFGLIDIIGSVFKLGQKEDLDEWIKYKDQLVRLFTCMASTDCHIYGFKINNLQKMRYEYL
jgi:hypothetical protein